MHPMISAGILFGAGGIIIAVCSCAIDDLGDSPRNAERVKIWRRIQLFGALQMLPLFVLMWLATIFG